MAAPENLPSGSVTFLFTDIEGSTRLAQLLGDQYRPVLDEHRRLLREAFRASGGVELSAHGDSFFVVFADPVAALTAGLAGQRALAGHRWPHPQARPRVRMGLHSGQATPHGGEYASPEVHLAARVAAAAHGGQIVCSAATAAGVLEPAAGWWLRDLGRFRLRGFDTHERLYELAAPGLAAGFPRPRTEPAAQHNLPAPSSSFVGREAECARLSELLRAHRLVTVVGTAGAGKTRLAVRVAAGRVSAYPDGVWFVDLATVTDPALVPEAVAAALGLRPEPGRPVLGTVTDYLATHRVLLLLDTGDAQPAAVAALVATALAAGRAARVLATGRWPLGLPGELVWRLPPLSLAPAPDGGAGEAVTLLAQRTATARGGAPVPAAELPELTRIAQTLAGLPLAIELAATRLRVLGTSQLVARIEALATRPGGLLAALEPAAAAAHEPAAVDRHRTLWAALDWSYRTLDPQSAWLLRALAVFAGPVELATARWLLAADSLPADPLAVLADRSLLEPLPHAERPAESAATPAGGGGSWPGTLQPPARPSFRMLEPIRAYARQLLAAAGEEPAARTRHAGWCLAQLRQAGLGPDGQPVTRSLDRLDRLAEEVCTALQWCVTGGRAGDGLGLVSGLDQWWRERGRAAEARQWLCRLYRRRAETGEPVADRVLGQAYCAHSWQAGAGGDHLAQLRYSRLAEACARRAGEPGLLAGALASRCWSLAGLGEPAGAERCCRELIEWAAAREEPADGLLAGYCLAQLLWHRGALDEAAELLGAARPAEATRPELRGLRMVDHLLGMVALARGDLVAAHDHLVVALRSRIGYGFHSAAGESLCAMAVRCAAGGDHGTAARLFGAVDALRQRLPAPQPGFGEHWARSKARCRVWLGDGEFDAAYASGSALGLAQAVAVALAVDQEARDLPAELAGQPEVVVAAGGEQAG